MILHKFWSAFVAQINKVANLFWEADPIAQMRYEYDQAVEQLKEGRIGLEQYRGLVERVTRQVVGQPVARRRSSRPRPRRTSRPAIARRRRSSRSSCRRPRRSWPANEQQLADARDGLRQQPEEDPAREREADRAAREDPEVRRRAEDERGRGRDRQARPRPST